MRLYRIIGNEGKVTIPHVLRQQIGFASGDVVSFEVMARDAVLVRRERLIEKDGANPDAENPSLQDFLESLSEKEQYAALVHLSVLWAESHGGKPDGRDCG